MAMPQQKQIPDPKRWHSVSLLQNFQGLCDLWIWATQVNMEELTRRCLVQILNHDIFHCQRRSVGVVTCLLCFCSSELLTLETTRLSTLHIDMLDSEIKSAWGWRRFVLFMGLDARGTLMPLSSGRSLWLVFCIILSFKSSGLSFTMPVTTQAFTSLRAELHERGSW